MKEQQQNPTIQVVIIHESQKSMNTIIQTPIFCVKNAVILLVKC